MTKTDAHSKGATSTERSSPSDESAARASGGDRPRRNRRRFLQGTGVVAAISLAACTEVTIGEDGITWGDDEPEATAGDDSASDDDSTEEEDDEIDLSQYEDGCFEGGTPQVSDDVRDGVEITVTADGVGNQLALYAKTPQLDGLEARDDLDDRLRDDDLQDAFADAIEEDDDAIDEDTTQRINITATPEDEEDDDE